MEDSFGAFVATKRKEKGISARQLAHKLSISPNYLCEIEKGKKNAFSNTVLIKMKETLCKSQEEEYEFYDLLAKEKNSIPNDVLDYIKNNHSLIKLIRFANTHNLSNEVWDRIIENALAVVQKE